MSRKIQANRGGWPACFPFRVLASDSQTKGAPLLARCSRGVGFEDARNSAFDFVLSETQCNNHNVFQFPKQNKRSGGVGEKEETKPAPINVHRIPTSRTACEDGPPDPIIVADRLKEENSRSASSVLTGVYT